MVQDMIHSALIARASERICPCLKRALECCSRGVASHAHQPESANHAARMEGQFVSVGPRWRVPEHTFPLRSVSGMENGAVSNCEQITMVSLDNLIRPGSSAQSAVVEISAIDWRTPLENT